jgi:transposase
MPCALSKDIRSRVVRKHLEGVSASQIALQLDISLASVSRISRYYISTGNVKPIMNRPGKKRKYGRGTVQIVQDIIGRKPSTYLDEVQHQLSQNHRINLSLSTIHRIFIP